MFGQAASASGDIDCHLTLIETRECFLREHRLDELLRVLWPILVVALGLALEAEIVFALFFFNHTIKLLS